MRMRFREIKVREIREKVANESQKTSNMSALYNAALEDLFRDDYPNSIHPNEVALQKSLEELDKSLAKQLGDKKECDRLLDELFADDYL